MTVGRGKWLDLVRCLPSTLPFKLVDLLTQLITYIKANQTSSSFTQCSNSFVKQFLHNLFLPSFKAKKWENFFPKWAHLGLTFHARANRQTTLISDLKRVKGCVNDLRCRTGTPTQQCTLIYSFPHFPTLDSYSCFVLKQGWKNLTILGFSIVLLCLFFVCPN